MFFSRIISRKNDYYSKYLEESVVNLLDRTFNIPQTSFASHLYKVEEEYESRPDLISLDAYGDEMYADIICKINGISNPYELAKDRYIILPAFETIENFYILPAEAWKESEFAPTKAQSESTVRLKAKTDTRKPNEAVVGDSRFNFDPISKIVIY